MMGLLIPLMASLLTHRNYFDTLTRDSTSKITLKMEFLMKKNTLKALSLAGLCLISTFAPAQRLLPDSFYTKEAGVVAACGVATFLTLATAQWFSGKHDLKKAAERRPQLENEIRVREQYAVQRGDDEERKVLCSGYLSKYIEPFSFENHVAANRALKATTSHEFAEILRPYQEAELQATMPKKPHSRVLSALGTGFVGTGAIAGLVGAVYVTCLLGEVLDGFTHLR